MDIICAVLLLSFTVDAQEIWIFSLGSTAPWLAVTTGQLITIDYLRFGWEREMMNFKYPWDSQRRGSTAKCTAQFEMKAPGVKVWETSCYIACSWNHWGKSRIAFFLISTTILCKTHGTNINLKEKTTRSLKIELKVWLSYEKKE